MRIKATLLAVLFSCGVTSVVGQGVGDGARKPDAEEVRSYYDEYEKSTMENIFIALPIKIFGEDSRLGVNAHFSYPGRQLSAPPENVQVALSVPCKLDAQLESDPIICVDGMCTSYHPRGEGVCRGGLLRERTSRMIDVPYEAFLQLAHAQSLSIRLPSAEVELSRGQIAALRKLTERMVPGKDSSKPPSTNRAG